jgi:hypothetical protein
MFATTVSTTAAEPTAPLRLGACFVDGERTSVRIAAVQGSDGGIRLGNVRHLDKSEAARATGARIRNYTGAINGTVGFKPLAQVGFRGIEREVSNKNSFHEDSLCATVVALRTEIDVRERLLGLGDERLFVRLHFFSVFRLDAQLDTKLALLLALGLGPLFFLTSVFFLAFGKSCAWSW